MGEFSLIHTRHDLERSLRSLPAEFQRYLESSSEQPIGRLPSDLHHILIVDPSDSAGAAKSAAAILSHTSTIPVVYSNEYNLPGFANEHTLLICVAADDPSVSQLVAGEGRNRGSAMVLISNLDPDIATDANIAVVPVNTRGLVRSNFGGLVGAILGVVSQHPTLHNELTRLFHLADQVALATTTTLTPRGLAAIASTVDDTIPIFVASGPFAEPLVQRAKASVNLNGKSQAFGLTLPEAFDDDIHGWGTRGDLTRQIYTLVAFRMMGDPPNIASKFDRYIEAIDEVVSDVIQFRPSSGDLIAQFLESVLFSDLLSLQLATGVEPHENTAF